MEQHAHSRSKTAGPGCRTICLWTAGFENIYAFTQHLRNGVPLYYVLYLRLLSYSAFGRRYGREDALCRRRRSILYGRVEMLSKFLDSVRIDAAKRHPEEQHVEERGAFDAERKEARRAVPDADPCAAALRILRPSYRHKIEPSKFRDDTNDYFASSCCSVVGWRDGHVAIPAQCTFTRGRHG